MIQINRINYRGIKGIIWDLDRFGWTPMKLLKRSKARELPKVFVTCIPKSGTHLIERILIYNTPFYRKTIPTIHKRFLDNNSLELEQVLSEVKNGEIVFAHSDYSDELYRLLKSHNFRIVFMYRRPFDVLNSKIRFLGSFKRHPGYDYHSKRGYLDRAKDLLKGNQSMGIKPFYNQIEKYKEWLSSDVFPIRYEDILVQNSSPYEEVNSSKIKDLFNFLGYSLDDKSLKNICQNTVIKHSLTYSNTQIPQIEVDSIAKLYKNYSSIDELLGYTDK